MVLRFNFQMCYVCFDSTLIVTRILFAGLTLYTVNVIMRICEFIDSVKVYLTACIQHQDSHKVAVKLEHAQII